MSTFREPCSPLHQGEEQRDTELFLRAVPFILLVGVMGGRTSDRIQLPKTSLTEKGHNQNNQ